VAIQDDPGAGFDPDMQAEWPTPEDTLIFCVDDDETILRNLTRFLKSRGYQVRPFNDPLEARAAFADGLPSLLLTDKDMPGITGIELAQAALEEDAELPVIVLTGGADVASATDALRLGIVDYLTKPPDLEKLESSLWMALFRSNQAKYRRKVDTWLRDEVEAKTREAKETAEELEVVTGAALSALVKLLEAKSDQVQGHSQAVSGLSAMITEALSLPEHYVKEIRLAGLLHDIGKVAIPDSASLAAPDQESQAKEHTRLAEEVLRAFPHLDRVAEYVLSHQERLDGSGFPEGLSGGDVPLGAQVVGVADAYQSMVDAGTGTPQEVVATLRGSEGTWFSGKILDALEKAVGS
jgi:putative two-component system response regulator